MSQKYHVFFVTKIRRMVIYNDYSVAVCGKGYGDSLRNCDNVHVNNFGNPAWPESNTVQRFETNRKGVNEAEQQDDIE